MKKLFAFAIPLFLIYPLNMSIETWGLMPKSQEDGETVEGAIVRLISAHEADPEAHTGTGESLAAHRASDMIDHPVGSIPMEKFSSVEFSLSCDFESLDLWTKSGHVYSNVLGLAKIHSQDNEYPTSYMYASFPHTGYYLSPSINSFLQFVLINYIDYHATSRWGYMYKDVNSDYNGWYFKHVNGVTTAVVRWNGVEQSSGSIGVSVGSYHVYRIQNEPADGYLRFYIDGEKVWEVDIITGSMQGWIEFRFETTATADPGDSDSDSSQIYVQHLLYAYNY
jgi:hypothetical protein